MLGRNFFERSVGFIVLALSLTPAYSNTCAKYPAAPRTIHASAAAYASTGRYSLDDEQILVFDYKSAYGGLGKFRNPYFISNYANALYRDYLDSDCKDEDLKARFLKQADYFVRSAVHKNGMALWTYPFPNKHFDLPPGWVSGIGQARIASVLWRAYGLTGDVKYKRAAYAGMEVYKHGLTDGGVITRDGDVTWIEEAPSQDGRSYKILNGHITGLYGVLDFANLTKDHQWYDVVRRAVLAVKRYLPKYDAGFTSYYSFSQPGPNRLIAGRHGYNSQHVDQLLSLYKLTKDSYFLEWASKFRAYDVSDYIFSAKGSTDPVGHGPDQASGLYGSHYWSSADFPTWIELDLHKPEYVKGLWIDGNGLKASPKDFSIQAFVDGQWRTVDEVTENHASRYVSHWKEPVKTDKIKLLIESDNGNHNVALQAVMPLLAQKKYAAITNECNNSTNNLSAATDDSDDTYMHITCGGWLIIPITHRDDSVTATFNGKPGATVEVEYSTSLKNWKRLHRIPANGIQEFRVPVVGFARIVFRNSLHTINNLKTYENKTQ